MQATGSRIVAKLGAEGLLCLAAPERGLGIAIASDDGMPRGLGPAVISTLEQLELADDRALCALREQFAGAVPSSKASQSAPPRSSCSSPERANREFSRVVEQVVVGATRASPVARHELRDTCSHWPLAEIGQVTSLHVAFPLRKTA